ncbi:DUF6531 domain-containing protein [uncultured Algibacter sp.]|uniref:DUF6531 domain-containing protein n=1 Tax=uncultured Algibacter sp. TaxID=298659 RepID=UPI0032162E33
MSNLVNRGVSDSGQQESSGFMAFLAEKKEKLDSFQANLASSIMPSLPGQPAGKYQDIAIGIDVHPTMFPPSPLMAVPHVGMVFDIMGAIFAAISAVVPAPPEPEMPEDGSDPEPQPLTVNSVAVAIVKAMAPSVMVNNKFIANAGVSLQHLPGIVLHALPSVSPMASSEMFMGSSTVLADGAPFSGQFLPALSCNLIGIPAPFRLGKTKPKMSLMAPTSALVTVIPGGNPVLVGGPPTIDLLALAMSLGLKGLGKLGRKAGGSLLKFTKKGIKKVSNKLDNLATKAAKRLQDFKCKHFGEPVDAATGRVISENLDFSLPGPIPLEWKRYYFSDAEMPSPIGSNWHHSYDIGYRDYSDTTISLQLSDGRHVAMPKLMLGDMYYNRQEKITWFKDSKGVAYKGEDGLTYRFSTNANEDDFYPIQTITNNSGDTIQFEYRHNLLHKITDSTGRVLKVTHENNRISAIYSIVNNERINFIRYQVDKDDNLVKVTEANNVSKHFYYEGHLLVKLTNQSGLSFYWEYQGKGDDAKCVHTWGDEGILEYWTQYENGKTIVTNALGHTTTYYYDSNKLIYRITDAKGGETYQKYNELQYLEMVTDPLGNTTKYTYDLFGNTTSIEDADKNKTTMAYDAMQRLISYTTPSGSMTWAYDDDNKLVSRSFPDDTQLKYEYNDSKQLLAMTDSASNRTTFTWNDRNELVQATLNDGRKIQWNYDALGNLLRNTQPNGAITSYEYDVMGNVIGLREPDGNKHVFEYDASGNVTLAKDSFREVAFTYWGLGHLKTRTENNKTITFKYNKEEQLTTIVNENNHAYRFTLDPLGQIVGEWGFDGLCRRYIRDAAGRVTKVLRPQERWTKYMYSGTGNILVADHYDGTGEYFSYDSSGQIKEATNAFNTVKFTYKNGKLISEDQNGHTVESAYSRLGQRTAITSSLGANITQEFAKDGSLSSTQANGWQAQYKRDDLGLEIQRMVSGDVTVTTQRDKTGRVEQHLVQNKNVEARNVRYQWGRSDRLLSMVNNLTNSKVRFSYDEVGNLAAAGYKNGLDTIYKMPDAVGNIFKSPNQDDREYGVGGKLLKDEHAAYTYDEEGNLILKFVSKAEDSNDIGEWQYDWFGNGMLKSVTKPNREHISFEYDALGRRTAKIVTQVNMRSSHPLGEMSKGQRGTITRFVWDGNVPLHEWQYNVADRPKLFVNEKGDIELDSEEPVPNEKSKSQLTTWVFEHGSFAPQAKIVGNKKYSIICDYLGTPVQAFDEQGENVWECELDIYGKVRSIEGSKTFIPFRYQGQYEDEETGLYYNRYRYYSSDTGGYISQDPIGLAGSNPNFYAYVLDSNSWIDQYGLDCNKAKWGKNNYAKDGEMSAIDHIWKGHSFHKAPKGKSKFRKNINTKDKVKSMVNETVSPENLLNKSPDGTKNFVKTFDHSIGTDINGNATNKIIVHTDPNGWVKSAYPF